MEITSFFFLIFYAAVLLLYYLIPDPWKKKLQWVLLLLASAVFYQAGGGGAAILWPVSAVLVTWFCSFMIVRSSAAEAAGRRRAALFFGVFLLLGSLALLKYLRFGGGLAIPLGISYYTFILTGYLIDVYNGIAEFLPNPFRLALYGLFFPLMTSGPITVFREHGSQLFEAHTLDYLRVTRGFQRMLWGFFKKLVIAERAAVLANAVFDYYEQYRGAWIWFGAVMFTIQLYTDFSGCMDIVLGVSETFGITLPENFSQPFFSKSIAEYWRRWHASLGVWMRNYVFYPLLRTALFIRLGKTLRRRLGKKAGKQLTTYAAMFLLWLAIGLWHGGDVKYVIGSGLLHWFYMVFGEATLPFWQKLLPKCHIPTKGRAADGFRVARTFFLVNIGNVFFRAASAGDALGMLANGWQRTAVRGADFLSAERRSILSLGLDGAELVILALSVLALGAVSVMEQRPLRGGGTGDVRERIAGKPLPLRWCLWMGLLFFVIIFGNYGPGYSSGAFIYAGF
ncbi:MBOAT family O-acyltransferase [Lachnoclostridium sp. Marseille-P6806]|uniref:MBOAT family O-acyltransferase n=1 Tax=Lachnoclostridium sp. Marseille-P6806 TaxID=2364793 RepID=UPI0010325965|nr:MBOAT family O-acyltransferase [Lachnoclostridium sp. Marseille-P6806]